MTEVHVRPGTVEQGSRETLPWRFDTTALLGPGETIGSPTATLTNLATGAEYAAGLQDVPEIDDVYVTQWVTDLEPRVTYRLSVGFSTDPTGKDWEMWLELVCPG